MDSCRSPRWKGKDCFKTLAHCPALSIQMASCDGVGKTRGGGYYAGRGQEVKTCSSEYTVVRAVRP